MPPKSHARLPASASDRWLHCPPSVVLSEGIPEEKSSYAEEGTDAHTLNEFKLRCALNMPAEDPRGKLGYCDNEMEECTDEYVNYVMEKLSAVKKTCRDPAVMVEQRLDFSKYVPEGFGTGDCLIVADDTLHIIDFKYGLGVEVSAEKNPQMMCYAIGAVELFDSLYDFKNVSMTIFQPRRSNVSTYQMSKDDLLDWANNTLAPIAQQANNGEGAYAAGKWCKFCRAKNTCRERASANLRLAQYEFQPPAILTDDEIADILRGLDELTSWADDVKKYALAEALNGKHWNGFKLVEGRSVRTYTDEDAVADAVSKAGYDPYEKKLLGITAMTSKLGKRTFNELLSGFITKPQGKPTLVSIEDKRPEIEIKSDFHEEEI